MKKNNIVNLFPKVDKTVGTVDETINGAIQDIIDNNIINCMVVMIDDKDLITYSYANFNKCITMIGALETMKNIYIEDGELNKSDD